MRAREEAAAYGEALAGRRLEAGQRSGRAAAWDEVHERNAARLLALCVAAGGGCVLRRSRLIGRSADRGETGQTSSAFVSGRLREAGAGFGAAAEICACSFALFTRDAVASSPRNGRNQEARSRPAASNSTVMDP